MTRKTTANPLSRVIVAAGVVGLVLLILLAPLIIWGTLFHLWNWWAHLAGWHVIIPVNWRTVLTAVVICWFLRWLVCRKAS